MVADDPAPRRRVRRRRVRYYLRRRIRSRRIRKHVSLFDIIGIGTGVGLSAFGSNGSDPTQFAQDPSGQGKLAINGIIAGVTGYNPMTKEWKLGNLEDFWLPVIGFHIVSWIAKKMGMDQVHIYKKIRLA
ncbi:MAG: hypothetical protein QXV17_12325 [Candidatus Micrarchaeaceae archaeon]